MNLKLNLNLKQLFPRLSRALPLVVGLALIGVFGYTAWVINGALNLSPGLATSKPQPKITFDKKTIQYVQSLKSVPGQTGVTVVGKTNPFGN